MEIQLSYADRLKVLGFISLKDLRERGDMIEIYKILSGKEHVDSGQFFKMAQNDYCMRGHETKLTKERSILDVSKHSFGQKIINSWNSLPAKVVYAKTVSSFKNEYGWNILYKVNNASAYGRQTMHWAVRRVEGWTGASLCRRIALHPEASRQLPTVFIDALTYLVSTSLAATSFIAADHRNDRDQFGEGNLPTVDIANLVVKRWMSTVFCSATRRLADASWSTLPNIWCRGPSRRDLRHTCGLNDIWQWSRVVQT